MLPWQPKTFSLCLSKAKSHAITTSTSSTNFLHLSDNVADALSDRLDLENRKYCVACKTRPAYRLISLVRKFTGVHAMASRYKEIINEHIQLVHTRKLEALELLLKRPGFIHWYLLGLAVTHVVDTNLVIDLSSCHDNRSG